MRSDLVRLKYNCTIFFKKLYQNCTVRYCTEANDIGSSQVNEASRNTKNISHDVGRSLVVPNLSRQTIFGPPKFPDPNSERLSWPKIFGPTIFLVRPNRIHSSWKLQNYSSSVKTLFITNFNLKQEIRQLDNTRRRQKWRHAVKTKNHKIIKCRKFKILHKQLHNKKN